MKRIITLFIVSFVAIGGLMTTSCSEEKGGTVEKIKVAVIFPDENVERFEKEYANILMGLERANLDVISSKCKNDTQMAEHILALKGKQVKCLLLCSINTKSSKINSALEQLKLEGTRIVCHDRLQQNTKSIDLYIGAENELLGKMLAFVATGNGTEATFEHVSGARHDINAEEVFIGVDMELEPLIKAGELTIPSGRNTFEETALNEWSAAAARDYFATLLDTYYKDGSLPVAIVCAADVIAHGVIAEIETRFPNLEHYPYISGQDNTQQSIKYIKEGKQSFTINKNSPMFVTLSTAAIIQFANGLEIECITTKNNGVEDIPHQKVSCEHMFQ